MKRQIRLSVFETNSSMTHSLTMCTDNEFQKWINGELYWEKWDEDFRLATEVDNELGKDNFKSYYYDSYEEMRRSEGYYTYDDYYEDHDFYTFHDTYTTPRGEIVHAFGFYGHD